MNNLLIGRRVDRNGIPHTDVQGFDAIVTSEDLEFAREAIHGGNIDDARLILKNKGSDSEALIDFIRDHELGVTVAAPTRPQKSTLSPLSPSV